jgi:signal transduction histidine kinase
MTLSLFYQRHLQFLKWGIMGIILMYLALTHTTDTSRYIQLDQKTNQSHEFFQLRNAIEDYFHFQWEIGSISPPNIERHALLTRHNYYYNRVINHLKNIFLFNQSILIDEYSIIHSLHQIETILANQSFHTDQQLYSPIMNLTPQVLQLKTNYIRIKDHLRQISVTHHAEILDILNIHRQTSLLHAIGVCSIDFLIIYNLICRLTHDIRLIHRWHGQSTPPNELQSLLQHAQQLETNIQMAWKSMNENQTKLSEKESQIKNITEQLIYTQENERQRISQFIHNDLGQHLTALNLEIATLTHTNAQTMAPLEALVQKCLKKVKHMSTYIHPPEINTTPFITLIQQHANNTLTPAHTVSFNMSLQDSLLSNHQKLTLFRAAQEALTNIIRHAHATKVHIELINAKHSIELVVDDNGVGIPTNYTASTGLSAIQYRLTLQNGALAIQPRSNAPGTRFYVTMPIGSDHLTL